MREASNDRNTDLEGGDKSLSYLRKNHLQKAWKLTAEQGGGALEELQ